MQRTRALPRRDFIAVIASLGGITLLSWLYLINIASDMSVPDSMSAMQISTWNLSYFWTMYVMWAVMMVGMMLPSVTPMVLIYAGVARKSGTQGMPVGSTGAFVFGYITMWAVFSLFATITQWGLAQAALLSPMMVSNSVGLGSALLIAAGIYQWLPIKEKCLDHCRSPVHFMSTHWRPGAIGAVKMGLSHGAFCLGCCWVLMTLLFVGGVMNLLWIATITLFILLEKVLPFGPAGGRAMGLLMITAGGIIAFIGA